MNKRRVLGVSINNKDVEGAAQCFTPGFPLGFKEGSEGNLGSPEGSPEGSPN